MSGNTCLFLKLRRPPAVTLPGERRQISQKFPQMPSTHVSRHIAAPRDIVYSALLDATAVALWIVPENMDGWVHVFDPSEGGVFRFTLTRNGSSDPARAPFKGTFHGMFVKLVPNERVVELLEIESDDPSLRGKMMITIMLSESGEGGTEVKITHDQLPPGISPAESEAGWIAALDRLSDLVIQAVQHA